MPKLTAESRLLLVLFIFLLIFSGCIKPAKKPFQFYITDFKVHRSLPGSSKFLANLKKPADLCVIPERNLLLVTESRADFLVNIYDLHTLKYLKSFVRRGVASSEQLDCQQIQYNIDRDLLYIADFLKNKIFVYSLNEISDVNAPSLPIRNISLQTSHISRPLVLSNRIIDLRNNAQESEKGSINIYDINGKFLSYNKNLPSFNEQPTKHQMSFALSGGLTKSNDGKQIILTYFFTDFIDTYDIDGKLTKRVQGPDIFDPTVKTVSLFGGETNMLARDGHKAYGIPKMNNNEVFVLYDGRSGTSKDYHRDKLLIFDRNLNPEAYFALINPIFCMDVDWKQKTIYGLSHNNKGKFLITYKY